MNPRRWLRRPPLVGPALDRVLEERLSWAPEALGRWAEGRLGERLALAARMPVYGGAGPALDAFPLLDRARLGARPDDYVHPGWPRALLKSVATSGSSGQPIRFWRDPVSALMEEGFLRRQLRRFGFSGGASLAIRAEGPRAGSERVDRAKTRAEWRVAASRLDDEAVRQAVALIEQEGVRLLRAYPSAALELVRRADVLGLLPRLRAAGLAVVHLSSETVTDAARARVEDALGVSVAEQYGLAERALLVQNCPAGQRHLVTDYAQGEVIDGEWVGTPLFGSGAVLVRYRTGDLAEGGVGPAGCDCGWPFPIVGRIDGRRDEVITTSDGRRVGRLGPALRGIDGLVAAQAEASPGSLVLRYVAAAGSVGVADALRTSVADLLRDPGTVIDLREEAPLPGPGGRVRAVVAADP